MNSTELKKINRNRKRGKIRSKISGTAERPRVAVFKSNTAISAQLIDDDKGVTLAFATSSEFKKVKVDKDVTGSDHAKAVGALLAKRAGELGVKTAVFDRGGYVYTGKVKAVAEGAREGGLTL